LVLKNYSYLLVVLCIVFIVACSRNAEQEAIQNNGMDATVSYALLGPISGANIYIRDASSKNLLAQTKTTIFNGEDPYSAGKFFIKLNNSVIPSTWILVSATGGVDIDSDDDGIVNNSVALYGTMKAYCKADDINNSRIIINAITTIAAIYYEQENNTSIDKEGFFNTFAQKIFAKSVDNIAGVDYRDILAYIPNKTPKNVFKNEDFYGSLLSNNFMSAILKDQNITQLIFSDEDNDTLIWFKEIVYGTSVHDNDSNHDGISDYTSYKLGLYPKTTDSDGDGLSDYMELFTYHTNPLQSDTDSDYLPDGVEIAEGNDPLDGDTNNNGIEDGLDGDPFFIYQWHLKSLGNVINNTANISTIIGNDLNILPLYHKYLGGDKNNKTVIQVIDTGVEAAHEDLDVALEYSLNAVNHTNDPTATQQVNKSLESAIEIGHGTAAAGIIGAITNNMLGVRGVVPRARIAGSNWLEDQTLGELEKVWYSQINDDKIAVSNNSWGAYSFDDIGYEKVLELATKNLRNSKGRIFVFAAGNFREDFGNANLSYLTNNPYVLTVAALNHKDEYASYSNPGSNVLVSAYGGEHYYTAPTIMTTLLMGKSCYESEIPAGKKGSITLDDDSGRNYTYAMNGTSAAAPIVSGIVALTLQACPQLSYRDIRWLIAHSSIQVDKQNSTWVQNSAGLWHSIDYGYGKINPLKMVTMCSDKDFETLPALQTTGVFLDTKNRLIPDTNTSITEYINIEKDLHIEWVGLTIDTDHKYAGDLEVKLVSPAGTQTTIIKPNDTLYAAYNGGFRFSSVAFIDEKSRGKWKVEIIDRLPNDYGYLKSIKLEIYGH